jgi:N-glycosylase/DNA lyase
MKKPVPALLEDWSEWETLPLKIAPKVLSLILDDGQAFRWHRLEDETWLGFWADQAVRLRQTPEDSLQWSGPRGRQAESRAALNDYLALDVPWPAHTDALPWRSDAHLQACLAAMPGLRLLRQPLGESLLCFLCSATKQIPQICEMAESMARELGSPLPWLTTADTRRRGSLSFHQLPTWEQLADSSENVLRGCALGFRAANVHKTALFLSQHPGWLAETAALPYEQAHTRLCELPGVGPKIADCVLLYSGTRLVAFPVDTWILKSMERHYALDGWSPLQIAHFGRRHFGPQAGFAQQFLFNFERLQR